MLAVPAAGHPVTPVKRDGPVEQLVRKLNADYALGVELPDPTLTPSHRKQLSKQNEQYARSDRICSGIRFLYYKRDGTLDHALESFLTEAKAESLRWVPKPRADPSTLPSARAPPKARTAEQQRKLQTLLVAILDDFKTNKTPKPAPTPLFSRPNGSVTPAARPAPVILDLTDDSDSGSVPESPASAASKRSWDFYDAKDQSTKRIKRRPSVASTSAFTLANALDNVPSRQHPGPARSLGTRSVPDRQHPGPTRALDTRSVPDRRPQGAENGRHSSRSSETSTGSTIVPSIFSQRDGTSTQSTLQTDARERKHAPSVTATPSRSFGARTVPIMGHPAHGLADLDQQSPPLSPTSPPFSDFSDSGDSPGQSTPGRASTILTSANGGNTAIQSRLQNIWRELAAQLQ